MYTILLAASKVRNERRWGPRGLGRARLAAPITPHRGIVARPLGEVVVVASALLPRGAGFATTLRATCRGGVVELDVSLPDNAPIDWRFEILGPGGERTAVETEPVDPNAALIDEFRRAVEGLPISGVATAESARDTLDVCRRIGEVPRAAARQQGTTMDTAATPRPTLDDVHALPGVVTRHGAALDREMRPADSA